MIFEFVFWEKIDFDLIIFLFCIILFGVWIVVDVNGGGVWWGVLGFLIVDICGDIWFIGENSELRGNWLFVLVVCDRGVFIFGEFFNDDVKKLFMGCMFLFFWIGLSGFSMFLFGCKLFCRCVNWSGLGNLGWDVKIFLLFFCEELGFIKVGFRRFFVFGVCWLFCRKKFCFVGFWRIDCVDVVWFCNWNFGLLVMIFCKVLLRLLNGMMVIEVFWFVCGSCIDVCWNWFGFGIIEFLLIEFCWEGICFIRFWNFVVVGKILFKIFCCGLFISIFGFNIDCLICWVWFFVNFFLIWDFKNVRFIVLIEFVFKDGCLFIILLKSVFCICEVCIFEDIFLLLKMFDDWIGLGVIICCNFLKLFVLFMKFGESIVLDIDVCIVFCWSNWFWGFCVKNILVSVEIFGIFWDIWFGLWVGILFVFIFFLLIMVGLMFCELDFCIRVFKKFIFGILFDLFFFVDWGLRFCGIVVILIFWKGLNWGFMVFILLSCWEWWLGVRFGVFCCICCVVFSVFWWCGLVFFEFRFVVFFCWMRLLLWNVFFCCCDKLLFCCCIILLLIFCWWNGFGFLFCCFNILLLLFCCCIKLLFFFKILFCCWGDLVFFCWNVFLLWCNVGFLLFCIGWVEFVFFVWGNIFSLDWLMLFWCKILLLLVCNLFWIFWKLVLFFLIGIFLFLVGCVFVFCWCCILVFFCCGGLMFCECWGLVFLGFCDLIVFWFVVFVLFVFLLEDDWLFFVNLLNLDRILNKELSMLVNFDVWLLLLLFGCLFLFRLICNKVFFLWIILVEEYIFEGVIIDIICDLDCIIFVVVDFFFIRFFVLFLVKVIFEIVVWFVIFDLFFDKKFIVIFLMLEEIFCIRCKLDVILLLIIFKVVIVGDIFLLVKLLFWDLDFIVFVVEILLVLGVVEFFLFLVVVVNLVKEVVFGRLVVVDGLMVVVGGLVVVVVVGGLEVVVDDGLVVVVEGLVVDVVFEMIVDVVIFVVVLMLVVVVEVVVIVVVWMIVFGVCECFRVSLVRFREVEFIIWLVMFL